MKTWRRRRYASAVVSLLSLVIIGVGTVVGILATSVLRPLPFAKPDQLFRAMPVYDGGMLDLWAFDDLQRVTRYAPELVEVTAMTPPERHAVEFRDAKVDAAIVVVAPGFFRTLGILVRAATPDAPGAAIVSQRLVRQLGIPAGSAVGKSIRIGGSSLTITAVIDRTVAFPADGDVWFTDDKPGRAWMGVLRARQGASTDDVGDRLSRTFQMMEAGRPGYVRVQVTPLAGSARPQMAGAQRMLIAGIGMFAIIAILNYGLLGIGEARRRAQEFAVRIAVGGTRAQVMRGLFFDQLALVGCALVVALAVLLPIALRVYDATELAKSLVQLPAPIWLTIAGTLVLLVLAAAMPTRVSASTTESEVLRRVNARGTRVEAIWNRAFVSIQFGVTAFLVVTGAVTVLGVLRDRNPVYGYDDKGATIGVVTYGQARQDPEVGAIATREFIDLASRAFPGRVTVYASTYRSMEGGQFKFAIEGGVAPTKIFRIPWMSHDVRPDFFDVVGIRIVRGRGFRDSDDADAEPVIILSERSARNLWGTTDVVGRRVRFGEDDGAWRTVVGVAADVFPIELNAFPRQASGQAWATSFAYRPFAQTRRGIIGMDRGRGFTVIVRDGSLANVSATLEGLLRRAAPGEKFARLLPLRNYLDMRGEMQRGEETMQLLFGFAVCGLILGIIGAIILIDDVVRSRTTEFGIRRALGAPVRNLITLASRETILAGLGGIIVGGLVGARFGPFVSGWLKATMMGRRSPPPTPDWALVAGIVVGLALLLVAGTALRALRAAKLDPAVALRTS